ncbi:hypothetical protein MRX96_001356 [Rhipicephalus microplus]
MSTTDVAVRRHCRCLGHPNRWNTWSPSWLGSQWFSCTGIEQATHEIVRDNKIAVIRHRPRLFATANTWCLSNGAAVNSKGSGTYLSDVTTINNTSVYEKVVSNDTMRTGAKVKRCEVVPADDVGDKGKTPKPKTPRLEFKEFQTWTSGRLGGIEQATHEKVEDHKIAVIRRGRRFVTKANTWRLINDAAVNSKGSGAYLSHMTTTNKTYVLQKVISNDTMRTGAKVKRCEVVPADDVGHKGKTPKPKTPRLKFKEFQTVGPVGAWEVSATMRRRRFS